MLIIQPCIALSIRLLRPYLYRNSILRTRQIIHMHTMPYPTKATFHNPMGQHRLAQK